jgi:hypothetical protein
MQYESNEEAKDDTNETIIRIRRSQHHTNWKFHYDGLSQQHNALLSDINNNICSISSSYMELQIVLAVILIIFTIVQR